MPALTPEVPLQHNEIFTRLLHHFLHTITKQTSSNRFVNFDIIQRNITKYISPIASVRHGEFIPAAVTPHAVHGFTISITEMYLSKANQNNQVFQGLACNLFY
jgi:hypothetical protein